jgi:hypothetical protein
MSRFTSLMAIAAVSTVGLMANTAGATVLSAPAALSAVATDTQAAEPVHCRPGRWHHRAGPRDGCYRRVVRPRAYYAPGPYYGGPYYGGPGYYYGGPAFYGPGISFGFGFGPRRRWGW